MSEGERQEQERSVQNQAGLDSSRPEMAQRDLPTACCPITVLTQLLREKGSPIHSQHPRRHYMAPSRYDAVWDRASRSIGLQVESTLGIFYVNKIGDSQEIHGERLFLWCQDSGCWSGGCPSC